MKKEYFTPDIIGLITVCIIINLGIGFIVSSLKLPFYLDSIGTVISTFYGGLGAGLVTGIFSVLIGSIYTPTLWAYVFTAIVISVVVKIGIKLGYLKKIINTIIWGIILGFVTAIVSAPVTTYIWKGASLTGADAITAFFTATGKTLLDSVILGGLSTDPIDKLFTSIIAFMIIKRLPNIIKAKSS